MIAYETDILVIGSGSGGGTAAWALARAGKRVLLVERGAQYGDRYAYQDEKRALIRMEPYEDRPALVNGRRARLFVGGIAGGGSALYGGVLMRPAPEDFTPGLHYGDRLDRRIWEWPISYEEMGPWYDRAEELYRVSGPDGAPPPHVGWRKAPFPGEVPALEPINERLWEAMGGEGMTPFHLPLAVDFRTCLRCPTCPGYLCPNDSRASSLNRCVLPAVGEHGLRFETGVEILRLMQKKGRITGALARKRGSGEALTIRARAVVLAAGAVGTPMVLERSGLGGESGQLGRNFMYHAGALAVGLFRKPTGGADRFIKQLGFTDLYFGAEDFRHKLGYCQALPVPGPESLRANAPVKLPLALARGLYERTLTLAGAVEDLPQAINCVTATRNGGFRLRHRFHGYDIHRSHYFKKRLVRILKRTGAAVVIGATGDKDDTHTAHQVGTARFGRDPASSVLDPDCRLHGVENLWVADGSFMPTSLGVGPALTIMANALRVTDKMVKEGI